MKKIAFALLVIPLFTQSCNRRTGGSGISLSGSSTFPGETIIVNLGKEQIKDKNSLTVTFNDKKASVVTAEGSNIEVMVPELNPGETKVTVSIDKKTLGNASFTIAPHPARKLVFIMDHTGAIKQIAEKFSNEELAATNSSAGRKIAFDLVDEKQAILVSGIVAHPMAGMEVFEDPNGKIRHEKETHTDGTFFITVPNIKGLMKLRLYDVTLTGDENNEKMLAGKKLITEISLESY